MAEKVVSVRLQARVEGFTAGMRKAKASVDDLTKADIPKATRGYADLANKAALAGGAIAVGLGVAVKRFADFDKAMSAVRANTGATGRELESLRAAALKLGADSQFSAKEAAEGVNELAKAGVKSQDILGGGLKGALDLAAAGQIGVAQAAETTASALSQFSLGGGEAAHVADLLAAGANKAQGGVGDLGAALNQAGLVAAGMGLSIEETTGGLAAFAKAGLIGSDAGTSFKTMIQRLQAPIGDAKAMLEKYNISAYDAQGNFVGLANVAGQLQDRFKNLTPEVRNNALAVIFGQDAIRGANVLYKEGAVGINNWVEAVDQTGFAAQQAADLTDNLSGDIERLGGAFDSVLIQTGSGANASLRTLVQGLEGLVNTVGKIPGPVLLAGGGLAALALGVPKGISAFRSYQATLDSVGLSFDKISAKGPRAAKAIGAVTASGKAFGAAMAVLAAAGAIDSIFGTDGSRPGTEVLVKDFATAEDAVSAFSDRLSTFSDQSSNWFSVDGVKSYGDALKYTFNPGLSDQIDGVVGKIGSFFMVTDKSRITSSANALNDIDTALAGLVSSGDVSTAARTFQQFADAAAAQGISVDELKAKFPAYANALAGVDNTQRNATGAVDDFTTAADDAAASVNDFAEALKGLNQPNLDLRDAQREVQDALQGTKDVVSDVRDKLIAKAIEDGKGEKAAKKWADAQLAAGEALNKNRTEFDITTEAGRAYQESIDGLAGAYQTQIEKQAEAGASQGELDKTLRTSRTELYNTAIRMGLTKEAAKAYVEEVLKIPAAVATDVTVNTAAAAAAVAALQRKINGLQGKDVRIGVRYNDGALKNGGRDLTGGITRKATGGAIYGPGTGTSDSIPALLSNGEHVLTAAEVSKLGGQSAVYALRKAVQGGWRPGFANGGAVQYAPRPQVVTVPMGPTSHSETTNTPIYVQNLNAADVADIRRKALDEAAWRRSTRGML